MRLLFITPQLPYPPQKGTTTRNFNIIKNLATMNEIHLLSFVTQGGNGGNEGNEVDQAVAKLRELCASVKLCPAPRRAGLTRLRDLFLEPRPDLAVRLASPRFVQLLRETLLAQSFDILQIEGFEMALHWEIVARDRAVKSRVRAVVFDEHNAEYMLQKRAYEIDRGNPRKWVGALYSLIQTQKLVRYEGGICRGVDGMVVVSEVDRAALARIAILPRVAIVPNGVDVEYFRLRDAMNHTFNDGDGAPPMLLFSGTMDFRPNVDAVSWFCRDILPRVHEKEPTVKFLIVGRDPLPVVSELGRDPRVEVTGFVEDVRPFLREASVYVVPMRFGGGIRFKVLEAMASGIPVVSTAMGAEGIEAEPGRHLVVADEPAEMAEGIVALLKDATRRQSMARDARSVIERNYDWRVIVPRLEQLYAGLI